MNKYTIFLSICLFSFSFAGNSMSDMKGMKGMSGMNENSTQTTMNNEKNDKLAICPVSKDKILPGKAFNSTVYKGTTYYFCCKACKPLFEKNPTKYLNKK